MCVVLVVDGDVVEAVFAFLIHPPDAVLNDDRDLEGVSGIIHATGRDDAHQKRRVAVLMLKSFTKQCRSPSRAAHHEALAARIGKSPDEIPDALETEHRVID